MPNLECSPVLGKLLLRDVQPVADCVSDVNCQICERKSNLSMSPRLLLKTLILTVTLHSDRHVDINLHVVADLCVNDKVVGMFLV